MIEVTFVDDCESDSGAEDLRLITDPLVPPEIRRSDSLVIVEAESKPWSLATKSSPIQQMLGSGNLESVASEIALDHEKSRYQITIPTLRIRRA